LDQQPAKKNQLADLEKGQAGRSVITVQNEQDKKALEERKRLLEEYDKQTYDIVQKQFQAGLIGSAGDPEGFNFLLKNGGDLLSRFANNAGLFKSSIWRCNYSIAIRIKNIVVIICFNGYPFPLIAFLV
jgi:hypothetical protein